MTYDITGHSLLGDNASALSAEDLTAYADAAEQRLGFAGTSLTGDDANAAKWAIVTQVNYMLDELADRAGGALTKESSLEWVGRTPETVHLIGVEPNAMAVAARLVGTGRKTPVASVQTPATKPIKVGRKDPNFDDEQVPFGFDVT